MTENEISFVARKAIFIVHNKYGPGLLESVYKKILAILLESFGLIVETEVPIPLVYEGTNVGIGFRIDLLLNKKVIIEVKAIEELAPVHFMQIKTYLNLTGIKLGLLVNFNTVDITTSIKRIVNKL